MFTCNYARMMLQPLCEIVVLVVLKLLISMENMTLLGEMTFNWQHLYALYCL